MALQQPPEAISRIIRLLGSRHFITLNKPNSDLPYVIESCKYCSLCKDVIVNGRSVAYSAG